MPDTKTNSEPFILFELAGTTYGLPAAVVQQMEMIEHITPVPNTHEFVEGVVFSRGQVIPVINLRVRFGFEKIAYDVRTRLIVIHIGNRSVGLITDTAREFVSIPSEMVQPPPEGISKLSSRYLTGIAMLGERMVVLIDAEEVLNFKNFASPAAIEN
ncbi:MAG TPA: chemotaxis protein CheW [Cyanobacteria bacterium UBA8803]|nr:chemotaxis protein CheW [Cyanobacteria bacterium UBA9273]HBL57449.1 chemotaxis protein CheW [Cyanobacteria bacterium UBA8803]